MGAWRLVGDIAWWVAACVLVTVLVWAAIERGRMHHLAALHRGLRKDAAAFLACGVGWPRAFRLSTSGRPPGRPAA
jgi:hypothetical protein